MRDGDAARLTAALPLLESLEELELKFEMPDVPQDSEPWQAALRAICTSLGTQRPSTLRRVAVRLPSRYLLGEEDDDGDVVPWRVCLELMQENVKSGLTIDVY